VTPSVGEVPIGGTITAYVETRRKWCLTFEDIKQDRFLVDIIPLTRSFKHVHSLLLFWKVSILFPFPSENSGGTLTHPF